MTTTIVTIDEVTATKPRDSLYRLMVTESCKRALLTADMSIPINSLSLVGIVFSTVSGENWPDRWMQLMREGKRVKAFDFESITHNAASGYAAIQLGLRGPHYAFVNTAWANLLKVARIQLQTGRATSMVVCHSAPTIAISYVLDRRPKDEHLYDCHS